MKECCRPGGGRTRNLLINTQTHIQLSHEPAKVKYLLICLKIAGMCGKQFYGIWLFALRKPVFATHKQFLATSTDIKMEF